MLIGSGHICIRKRHLSRHFHRQSSLPLHFAFNDRKKIKKRVHDRENRVSLEVIYQVLEMVSNSSAVERRGKLYHTVAYQVDRLIHFQVYIVRQLKLLFIQCTNVSLFMHDFIPRPTIRYSSKFESIFCCYGIKPESLLIICER